MTNSKIIGMMLVALAAAISIGLVTIGFQSAMATKEEILMADVEEDVEAGNASTTTMTNQTTSGNMTGASPTSDTSANESGRISDTVSVIGTETETPITTCDDGC